MADAIKKNPVAFGQMTDCIEDICSIVSAVIKKELPKEHEELSVFCELLPLNRFPTTYPFPGFVLNIQCCTEGHTDNGDTTICAVIPFGDYEGGELVLHEAGLVLDIKRGDVLIFPSHLINHFNLHFKGFRGSIVMHSDKEVARWNFDRNGWNKHIVT